jgi:hypothetical protein
MLHQPLPREALLNAPRKLRILRFKSCFFFHASEYTSPLETAARASELVSNAVAHRIPWNRPQCKPLSVVNKWIYFLDVRLFYDYFECASLSNRSNCRS